MRIIFMARRVHAVSALEWLVANGHDVVRVVAPAEHEPEVPTYAPSLREVARRLGLVVTTDLALYRELADPIARARLGEVDLVASYLFWKRIKEPLLTLGRLGCINLHPAPLPDYQGVGGFNFAILDRQRTWGASAHYVDATFDTGPIIEVRRFAFDWRTATALSLEMATRPIIGALFRDIVTRVAMHGVLPTTPNVGGRYISRHELEAAKRIAWDTSSTDEICLRSRAFWYPPHDGAYIEKDRCRFTLVSPAILASLDRPLPQGAHAASSFDEGEDGDPRGSAR